MDLYTFGTPNGHKISIMLEELNVPYNVKKIDILKGDQKSPDFLKINPNGKIPALVDGDTTVFETIAIMIYLADKYGMFLPRAGAARYEVLQWCMFQAAGLAPNLGQFGHFTVFAKEKVPYAIERFSAEVDRLFNVLDQQLAKGTFLVGDDYTIADIATWPWIEGYMSHYKQEIDVKKFPHLKRWYFEIAKRPAVQRGVKIPA